MWGSVANSGLVGSAVVDGNSIDFIAVDIELTTSGLSERDEVPTGYKRFILKILFSERKLILFIFFSKQIKFKKKSIKNTLKLQKFNEQNFNKLQFSLNLTHL